MESSVIILFCLWINHYLNIEFCLLQSRGDYIIKDVLKVVLKVEIDIVTISIAANAIG